MDVEEVSGALNLMFMGTPITNAYRNLTNIILRVSPKRALAQPAVLINAHFDSAFGSPGDQSAYCASRAGGTPMGHCGAQGWHVKTLAL